MKLKNKNNFFLNIWSSLSLSLSLSLILMANGTTDWVEPTEPTDRMWSLCTISKGMKMGEEEACDGICERRMSLDSSSHSATTTF